MTLSQALLQLERVVDQLQCHRPDIRSKKQIEAAQRIYLLAPSSFLGHAFAAPIARRILSLGKQVVLVDDTLPPGPNGPENCAVQGLQQFRQERPSAGLAINLANTPFVHGLFERATASTGISILDIVPVLDVLDLPVIYETAGMMRSATLARLNDYIEFAHKLDDVLSVQTLSAFLQMRITLDRAAVLPVLCSLEDEYFSPHPAGKDVTFALGSEEAFCDVGAHVGSTVRKFLAATQWRYAAIHAFEPDSGSFATLTQGMFKDLLNFHAHNMALSNERSMLGFAETGTMGSRLDAGGNVQVQASTLDAEVPRATFIKMDVEGHETKILQGARRLISQSKPRLAITGYHYADDLLDIARLVHEIEPGYRLRLRHHSY